jgi:hypothetical protein
MILSLGKDLDLLRRPLSFDLQANESNIPIGSTNLETSLSRSDEGSALI